MSASRGSWCRVAWRLRVSGCPCTRCAPGGDLAAPRQMTVARAAERFGPILDVVPCWRCPAAQCERLPGPDQGRRRGHGPRLLDSRRVYRHRLHSLRPTDRTSGHCPGERHTYPGLGKHPTSAMGPRLCVLRWPLCCARRDLGRRRQFATGSSSACITRRPATGLWLATVDGLPFDPPIVGLLNVVPTGPLDSKPHDPLIVEFGDAIRMAGESRGGRHHRFHRFGHLALGGNR